MIRIINNSDFLAHTRPLFQSSNILDLEKLRKLSLGIYCFKNKAKFNNLLPRHNYSTRNRNLLRPIKHRTTHFEKSFVYQAPRIWNDIYTINPALLHSNSVMIFKRKYRINLMSND